MQQVFVHPLFNSETFDSDVALLLLERPISRGPASTPACLPDQHLASYLLQVIPNGGHHLTCTHLLGVCVSVHMCKCFCVCMC